MRTRLSLAASRLAGTLYGREWRILEAKRIAHDGLTDGAEIERFAKYWVDLEHEVELRLGNGEWTAWGWRQGDTTPVKIPIELFERSDVQIDRERCTISCAVCAFDTVTVDAAMEGIPAVDRPQRIGAIGIIKPAFDAWVASLPEPPTQKQAKTFAKDRNFVEARVLDLWKLLPKRTRGRPPKAK
jgi:hypothetical protein